MTTVERLIAACADRKSVEPGETLLVTCGLAVGSEIIFPHIVHYLDDLKASLELDHNRIALVNGHLSSTKDAAVGSLVEALDHFAAKWNIPQYYQSGRAGNCGTLIAQQGLVGPGDFIVGSDQHTTAYGAVGALATGVGGIDLASAWTGGKIWLTVPQTWRIVVTGKLSPMVTGKDFALALLAELGAERTIGGALEFCGEGIANLTMADRFAVCNLTVETGVQFALMPVDSVLRKYLKAVHFKRSVKTVTATASAKYAEEIHFDLGKIVPMVAQPYQPVKAIPARNVGDVPVNQVVIGSCTNGEIADFRLVADFLRNRTISKGIRFGLWPASHQTVRDLIENGLALELTQAGATIAPPSCQACLGSGPSMIGENEVGVYTTNRNYRGRHGPASARIFLAGPLVAIASAIKGKITDPRDIH